jgi:hypothetical protein
MMRRERALEVVLVLVGLIFVAGVYPLILMAKQDPSLAMMMSLYETLGIFLLLAAQQPVRESQLGCFHGMVEFRPRGAYDCASIS